MAGVFQQTLGVASGGNALTQTITLSAGTTAGNMIFVGVYGPAVTPSVYDSKGNSYVLAAGSNSLGAALFYAADAKSLLSGDTISAAVNSFGGGMAFAEEWSGVNSLDIGSVTGHAFGASSFTLSASLATNFAAELIYAIWFATGIASMSPNAGYTNISHTVGSVVAASEYQSVSSTGTYAPTETPNVAGAYYGGAASFYAQNPGTPAAPTLTQNTALTNVTATWAVTSHTTSYNVQRSTTSGVAGFSTIASGLTSPTYTDPSPPTGNVWYLVQSVNGIGTVSGTATAWAIPATTAAPTLTTNPVPLTVTIAWTPVAELGVQTVQRSTDGTNYIDVVTGLAGNVSAYGDQSVAASTLYYYRIVAQNDIGSTNGTAANVTTPAPPLALSWSTQYTPINIALSWQGVTPVVGGNIVAVTNTTNPTITTLTAHGLTVGTGITIAGVLGATGVNSNFVVQTVPTATTFTVTLGSAPGAYTAGGTVTIANVTVGTSITGVTNVTNPVVTTSVAHGLPNGVTVTIAGVVGATGANGTWVVSSVTSTTFTITTAAPGAYTAGGTVTLDSIGYIPQRSTTNNGSDWAALGPFQVGTTFTDGTVSPGVLYYYRVQGIAGGTFYSPVAGIYAPGPAIPGGPQLGINPYFPEAVSIWWKPVVTTKPATYTIQRSNHNAALWQTLAKGVYGAFYEDEGVPYSGSWDYRIIATDIPPGTAVTGYTNTGPISTINVPIRPPDAPLLGSLAGSLSVHLGWTKRPSAQTYTIQRSTDACQTWTNAATGVTATSYDDSGLTAYTRYWYRVVSVNGANSAAGLARSIFVDGNANPPNGYRLILAGVDQSTKMTVMEPKLDRQVAGQGAQLTAVLRFDPGPNTVRQWDAAVLLNGAQVVHHGWVQDYVRVPDTPTTEVVTLTAPDSVALCLNTTYVSDSFEQQTAGFIVRSLLGRYVPGLTVGCVQDGPVIPYLSAQGESLLSVFRKLLTQSAAAVTSPFFHIAPDLDVYLTFGSTALEAAPFVLSDENTKSGRYGA